MDPLFFFFTNPTSNCDEILKLLLLIFCSAKLFVKRLCSAELYCQVAEILSAIKMNPKFFQREKAHLIIRLRKPKKG